MFDHLLRPRRVPRRRRLAALLVSTSQCGVLGSALVLSEPHVPELVDVGEAPVLVEGVAQAAGGGGGGGVSLPMKPPPPAVAPPIKPPPAAAVAPEVSPEQPAVDEVSAAADLAARVASLVPVRGGAGVDLGLGLGPGSGPGTGGGSGECAPGEDCATGPGCAPGEVCGTGPVEVEGLRVRRRVQPAFPPAARHLGLSEARCLLELTVDERGHVADVAVSGCPTVFHESAERAAWGWRFVPHRVGGEARSASFRLVVNYQLR